MKNSSKMFRRTCPGLVFLLLLSFVPGQQRTVVVKQADRELKRVAFQLKVSPAQVLEARRLLRTMTALASDLPERSELRSLGGFWITLDEPDARDALRGILQSLSQSARDAVDSKAYLRITGNADTIADGLGRLDPELRQGIMDDWPAPPELLRDQRASLEGRQRNADHRRLWASLVEDVDAGLRELRRLEEGGPRLEARQMALNRLFNVGRLDEAQELLDETLELASKAPSGTPASNELQNLMSLAVEYGTPAQLDKLVQLWASALESADVPGSQALTLAGPGFTARENRILDGLSSLSRRPELALEALDYFPDLKQKVQAIGGLGAVHQERRRHWQNQNGASDAERSELETEFDRTLRDNAFLFSIQGFNQKAERLEELISSLPQLGDPLREANFYQRAIQYYFSYRGELTSGIRRQGLKYVDEIRKQQPQESQPEGPSRPRFDTERLEANIYAMWLWSDPQEASQAFDALPAEVRLQALGSYLENLTRISSFSPWNMR